MVSISRIFQKRTPLIKFPARVIDFATQKLLLKEEQKERAAIKHSLSSSLMEKSNVSHSSNSSKSNTGNKAALVLSEEEISEVNVSIFVLFFSLFLFNRIDRLSFISLFSLECTDCVMIQNVDYLYSREDIANGWIRAYATTRINARK